MKDNTKINDDIVVFRSERDQESLGEQNWVKVHCRKMQKYWLLMDWEVN